MVDRPIKKSDREAAPQQSDGAEGQSAPARRVPPPVKKADRKDGEPAKAGIERIEEAVAKVVAKAVGKAVDAVKIAPLKHR